MGLASLGRRLAVGFIAIIVIIVAPAAARAQTTYTWNLPTSGGSWQTAGNWLPNSGTPSLAQDIAIFGGVATGANSVSLTGSVTIGELHFTDVNTGSTTAAYSIGAAAQTITLNNGGSPDLIT